MYNYGKWYTINRTNQYVHILSNNLDNPILIYIHGGPGDATLPLAEHFNSDLSKKYTFIIWEQRGAGKSYYKFKENEKLTIDRFVVDLKVLIEKMLVEFKKEKVCLLGHSWGSIIGMKFIIQYPDLIQFYIGVGQVICSQKMFDKSREYLEDHTDNLRLKNKISSLNTTFNQESWYSDLMFFMSQLIKQKVSLYGKSSYLSLYPYFITSKNYSLLDCIKRLKGSKQSIVKLWHEVSQIDFSDHEDFKVPIAFIEGEYDYHASNELVYHFYQKIKSPKIYFTIRNTAHFPQWTRSDIFNSIVNSLDFSTFSNNGEMKIL
ncbi:alpha/beta hydrolase [Oceanobacillus neutriphilus]|uniref:Alpha/beta hydrolase n=1 Tax=Oceanobacillus neutriphilus TaxID=531815 RepID=A0ABQ2NUL1_9BACI|nr:alpha/beta hydrolase [Oceanobacillus neutriphilus]